MSIRNVINDILGRGPHKVTIEPAAVADFAKYGGGDVDTSVLSNLAPGASGTHYFKSENKQREFLRQLEDGYKGVFGVYQKESDGNVVCGVSTFPKQDYLKYCLANK